MRRRGCYGEHERCNVSALAEKTVTGSFRGKPSKPDYATSSHVACVATLHDMQTPTSPCTDRDVGVATSVTCIVAERLLILVCPAMNRRAGKRGREVHQIARMRDVAGEGRGYAGQACMGG